MEGWLGEAFSLEARIGVGTGKSVMLDLGNQSSFAEQWMGKMIRGVECLLPFGEGSRW